MTKTITVTPSEAARAQRPEVPLVEYSSYEEWENRIFRTAQYFTVVRFGVPGGSECLTTQSFPVALAAADSEPRSLIYCVGIGGHAFCLVRKDWGRFAQLWLARHNNHTS